MSFFPDGNDSNAVARRLFVVGCSRSGTTLLQVRLATHPRVASFPETAFFKQATGRFGRALARWGLPTSQERVALWRLLAEIGRPDLGYQIPGHPLTFKAAAARFVALLDRVAREDGCDVWLEKTPMHVHYIDLIERFVPAAHVIHILRDGRDVVASIVDRARTYPERFGDQAAPSFGIRRWNRALEASLAYREHPGHSFLTYEALVEDPSRVLRRLCQEAGLRYHEAMAGHDAEDDGSQEVRSSEQGFDQNRPNRRAVVPDHRPWIEQARRPPQATSSKFKRLFNEPQRRRITEQLNLELYHRLRKSLGATASSVKEEATTREPSPDPNAHC